MSRLVAAVCLFLAIVQQIPIAEASHKDVMHSMLQGLLDSRADPHGHHEARQKLDLPAYPKSRDKATRFAGPDQVSALKEPISNSLHLLRVTGAKTSLDPHQSDEDFLSGKLAPRRRPKQSFDFAEDLREEFRQR
jgi:hypothetical protein